MASDWVKIFPALYYCDKEIGFICRTSVGGRLMSFLAKRIASNFLQAIGMNTRVSILEQRLIWSSLLCRRKSNRIFVLFVLTTGQAPAQQVSRTTLSVRRYNLDRLAEP